MTVSASADLQLARARTFHQEGRLAEAVPLYKEVLTREPHNSEALHLLGLAMATLGHARVAVQLFTAAVQLEPANADMLTNLASGLSAAGRHAEAVSYYDRALGLQPSLAMAHRGRGSALLLLGQHEDALASFGQAVRLSPTDDQAHNSLGVALKCLNRWQEARQFFAKAAALDPNNAHAHHNLGLADATLGRHREALASIERSMRLQPNDPAVYINHGIELLVLGRPAEALVSFQSSLALQPGQAIAHHNSGLALMSLERYTEARDSFYRTLGLTPNAVPTLLWLSRACMHLGQAAEALATLDRALALAPQTFDIHFQRGIVLAGLERHAESVASFDQAVALNAASPEAVNNRGAVLMRLFRPEEALQDFSRATALRPDYADAYVNAGNAHRGLGHYGEALDCLDRALAIKPDDPTATWSKAIVKLALGDFAAGWPLYESRLLLQRGPREPRESTRPRWRGNESIAGKTLLVYADQGLGDTLQFCRYVPVLEAMGANVIFEVQPVLKRLLGSLALRGRLLGRGEPLPEFDLHSPLASLPLALGTRIDTIPARIAYLSEAAEAVRGWEQGLSALPGLRVGLNWQGDPTAEKLSALEARSFPLAAAAALARLEGVSLVSLQKGAGAEQRMQVEFGARLAQLTDPQYMGAAEIAGETAALIKGLDLIITADTALAHLAGALGARVWVVLQAVPDWRWLIDRSDSPWYPTMRLFRQRAPGDWQEVFGRIATEIAALQGQGPRS